MLLPQRIPRIGDNKSSNKYVMVESASSTEENEIELIELIRTLLMAWKMIVSVTVLFTVAAFAYAFTAPVAFRAEVLLAPVEEEQTRSSSVLSRFGGLADIAGIPVSDKSKIEQVIATLKSGKFLQAFIQRNKLLPVLFEDRWDSENQTWRDESVKERPSMQSATVDFKNILSVQEDRKTGLFTLAISGEIPKPLPNGQTI